MISCKTFEQAESIAKKLSAEQLRSISIVQRCNYGKSYKTAYEGQPFIVCDNYKNGIEDRKSHDKYIMLITNYNTPFEVYSISPKSGEHWEMFPTKELALIRMSELRKDGYRKNIRSNF
jgi:hypothetical protein